MLPQFCASEFKPHFWMKLLILLLGAIFVANLFKEVCSGQSYYSTLGLEPKATESEIRKAFKKLAMKVTTSC